MLASTRVLSAEELDEVQRRIRRGETLRPSEERLAVAGALLSGRGKEAPRSLKSGEEAGLVALCVLLTPIPALAAAWSWRDTPAGRSALRVAGISAVVDIGLLIAATWMN